MPYKSRNHNTTCYPFQPKKWVSASWHWAFVPIGKPPPMDEQLYNCQCLRSPQPSRRVKITTLLLSKQVLPSSKSGIMLLKEKCLFFGLWNLKPGKCKKIIGSSSIDVKVKVTQSCPTLCDLMDCNLSRSSFHGILH